MNGEIEFQWIQMEIIRFGKKWVLNTKTQEISLEILFKVTLTLALVIIINQKIIFLED